MSYFISTLYKILLPAFLTLFLLKIALPEPVGETGLTRIRLVSSHHLLHLVCRLDLETECTVTPRKIGMCPLDSKCITRTTNSSGNPNSLSKDLKQQKSSLTPSTVSMLSQYYEMPQLDPLETVDILYADKLEPCLWSFKHSGGHS
jgi:hypothetical protein